MATTKAVAPKMTLGYQNSAAPSATKTGTVATGGNFYGTVSNAVNNLVPKAYAQTASSPVPTSSAYGQGYDAKGNLLNNPAGQMIYYANQPTTGVLGASTGGGAGGGAPTSNLGTAPQIPNPSGGQTGGVDFDALIAPALANLEQAVGQANTDYGTQVGSINNNADIQRQGLNQNIDSQSASLDQSRTTQQNLSQSAADQARRQYSEIQQGLQSRYGGTTGTGAFATEIAGQQTLQNVGKINQDLSGAIKSIDDKVVQVKEVGRIALADLNQKVQDQLGQAKSQLDNLILNIRGQQGMLQAQKAQMTAQAIQNYQNSVNAVQTANAQFSQQIYAQQLAAEQNLNTAKAQAQQYGQYTPSATTYGQTTPVGQTTTQGQPTGQAVGGSLGPSTGGTIYDTLNKNLFSN